MTYFMQMGDAFRPTAGRDSLLESLPVGVFIVQESMEGLFYKRVPSFEPEGRTYGNVDRRADRIMQTFLDRERATGVLLSGEKGSGKTRMARQISRMGAAAGFPTILVNAPFGGDAFSALLSAVEVPAIVILDEFEKVYDEDRRLQEQVLTLLDGTMTSKKLFILTVNDEWKVDSNMKNRPGRLFYHLQFSGVDSAFIRDYCEHNLKDQEKVESVTQVAALFEKFNFDLLKAVVEEMNRYDETAFDVLDMLNAKPIVHEGYGDRFSVSGQTKEGIRATVKDPVANTPLTARGGAVGLYFQIEKESITGKAKAALKGRVKDEDVLAELLEDQGVHVVVRANDVRRMDADRGLFEFETPEGYIVRYTRLEREEKDLRHLTW